MAVAVLPASAKAETVGEVDTVFKLIGPDHKIVVEAYDDPKVNGVTCYVSRAKTGGVSGALGFAEDKAEASIACRQVGPLSFTGPLKKQDGSDWLADGQTATDEELTAMNFFVEGITAEMPK